MGLYNPQASSIAWPRLELSLSSCLSVCNVSRFVSGDRRGRDSVSRVGRGFSKVFLRLVLGPHLLSTHLVVVVHRTSAVRALLVVVHLSRRVDTVAAISVCVVVLRLLAIRGQAVMGRLPTHGLAHVRAVGGAAMLLLSMRSRRRLENLRRVVARRRVGGERRALAGAIDRHLILRGRTRAGRGRHLTTKVSGHSGHAVVHGLHVVVRSLPLHVRDTRHGRAGRHRRRSAGMLRHR